MSDLKVGTKYTVNGTTYTVQSIDRYVTIA